MAYSDYRISKLRDYLFGIINTLTANRNYQISADYLGGIDDFSLDKIPTNTEAQKWIIGVVKRKEVYSFRSRKTYSQDTINNLTNIGFFEDFENKIMSNNDEGILPDIKNIESIECLNCGTLIYAGTDDATFDIQIQITYRESKEREVSL